MPNQFDDHFVPRLSDEECEKRGSFLNTSLGGGGGKLPPLMDALACLRSNVPSLNGLELVTISDEAMGRARAKARPDQLDIVVGVTLLGEIIDDKENARFDLTHELAHILWHKGPEEKFLIEGGNKVFPSQYENENAEWQADRIARAALMPPSMVGLSASDHELAIAARVERKQAYLRRDDLSARAAKVVTPALALKIAQFKQAAGVPDSAREQRDLLKLSLWNKLPTILNEPPEHDRQCGKYRIRWAEFGKTTECGWFIEGGRIRSFFGSRYGE